MARLLHARSGRAVTLPPQAVAGRSSDNAIPIDNPVVSSQHAALSWRGEDWWIRDLGSRNGTFVDGRRLDPGEEVRLVAGTRLAFGDVQEPWLLESADPPRAEAVRLADGRAVVADAGVLLLPDDDLPVLALVRQPDGGWARDDDGEPVHDGQVLDVDGDRWRLALPALVDPTVEARPQQVRLRFRVSRDEEYVEIDVENEQGAVTRLRPRSFNYLLLTLARLRLDDAALPETSRGWVDQERLARQLQLQHRSVNVQVCRARRALGKVREDLGTRLIERRQRSSQLRLGLDSVTVEVI